MHNFYKKNPNYWCYAYHPHGKYVIAAFNRAGKVNFLKWDQTFKVVCTSESLQTATPPHLHACIVC